jgi:hypothetical protein
MAAYLVDGRAIDAILALVAVEAFMLLAWRMQTGRGPAVTGIVANLASGACLLLALRFALSGAAVATIAACLAASLVAHLTDLAERFRGVTHPPAHRRLGGILR